MLYDDGEAHIHPWTWSQLMFTGVRAKTMRECCWELWRNFVENIFYYNNNNEDKNKTEWLEASQGR